MFDLWYTRVGGLRLVAALLVVGAVLSGLNLVASSATASRVCVVAALLVSAAIVAVLVKHIISRADLR